MYLKTTAVGYLGQDCRQSQVNGKDVLNFSIAYTESFKDAQGVRRDKTLWISAAWWTDRTGIAQYLKKGTLILCEGVPEVAMYQDKQGKWQAEFKLRVSNIKLLGGAKDNSNSQQNQSSYNGGSNPASDITEPLSDLPF